VGTGINTPLGFAAAVIGKLRESTGLPLSEARNHFEAQGARDALVETSGQLRTVAVGLYKIANDIRWMGSGPRAGLRELRIPDLQPGSSIMPGKVNPSVPEMVNQVCFQVLGCDLTVCTAAEAGQLELNVMMPVIAWNALHVTTILGNAMDALRVRTIDGMKADARRCRELLDRSTAAATALSPHLGYARTAEIATEAASTGRPIRDLVIERGWMAPAAVDRVLSIEAMTRPGISGEDGS
jgi:fumarate hydratase class II